MARFFHVYILQSIADRRDFYVGYTEDLEARLRFHNEGGCPHTSKRRPLRIKTATAFSEQGAAIAFEKYLKSPSGRAFAKKRL